MAQDTFERVQAVNRRFQKSGGKKDSDLFRFHLKKSATYKMTYGSIEDGHVHVLEAEEIDTLYQMQQTHKQQQSHEYS